MWKGLCCGQTESLTVDTLLTKKSQNVWYYSLVGMEGILKNVPYFFVSKYMEKLNVS